MPFLSVCIPTYEMNGLGQDFLRKSFEILSAQTFKNFEIIVSDHSQSEIIKNVCQEFANRLTIHYFRNNEKKGNSSANINNAIRHATGKLVKVLFQDDFLYSKHALEETVEAFDLSKDRWLVSACEHTKNGQTFERPFYPAYNENIHLGKNTISSPSVLTIKNERPLLFDEQLIWLMDVDYYKRCHDAFGPPKILNTITVVNRVGDHQVSNTLATKQLQARELAYLKKKFRKLQLPMVTLVAVSSIKIAETIHALSHSMRHIQFAQVLLISDQAVASLPAGITITSCPPLKSIDDYSRFMLYELAKYVTTDFALVVQHDGYVVRPHKWDPSWLSYDYIGAPWPKNVHFTPAGVNVRVGNGGFSLRSRKILEAPTKLDLPFTNNGTDFFNEDGVLCNYHRAALEQYGVRYAPPDVAARFSREQQCAETVSDTFGFHKNELAMPKGLFVLQALKKKFSRV